MIKHLRYILGFLLLSFMVSHAQPVNPDFHLSTHTLVEINIQAIALVDIESAAGDINFDFEVEGPSEAGVGFDNDLLGSNSNNWINYTSAVPTLTSRNIQVSISEGSIPAALELRLQVSTASATGGGQRGTPVGAPVVIDGTPKDIITGITGAFTGNGASNGHQLVFELYYKNASYQDLEEQTEPLTILYTIIDN